MTQTPFIEDWHDFGFIVSQASGHRSIDRGEISGDAIIPAGSLLSKSGDGKYAPIDAGSSDSAEAILCQKVDPANGSVFAAILTRDAEINSEELSWPDGMDADKKKSALDKLAVFGIIAR